MIMHKNNANLLFFSKTDNYSTKNMRFSENVKTV